MEDRIIDHSKQAPAHILAGKYGPGVYLAYKRAQPELYEGLEIEETPS
jgi:hypothetical protein